MSRQTTKYVFELSTDGKRYIRVATLKERHCLTCGILFKPSEAIAKYCSRLCYYKMKVIRGDRVNWTTDMRERVRKSKLGSNNPQWRGGVTVGRLKEINTMEYKAWRRAVFERDNYTCIGCKKRGGYLNADHVTPWWKEPSKRLEVSNGQTLCGECHKTKTRSEMKVNWVNQYASAR